AARQRVGPSLALSVGELLDLLTKATGELVTSASGSLLSALSSRLTFLPVFLIGFVFMIVSSFTIGMDYKRVTSFLLRQIPQRFQTLALDIKSFLVSCLLKLLRAYLLIMTVTFCELSLGLWSLHVANFWKIAAITAALDILPLVGSGAVLITWGIYQLIIGNYPMGMGLLILWGVITTVRNIIEPRIVGDQLGLHPVATLTAMFLGLRLAGFPGLLAAPVLTLLLRYLNSTGRIQLYRT
ncbi:MAG: AI-2E family transporter, partial [Oscillospiraceae bacterium]